MAVQISISEEAILRVKRGPANDRYTQNNSAVGGGQNRYAVDADWVY